MAEIKQGFVMTGAGQTTSGALRLVSETLVGIYMPSVLDAAKLKVQASQDGSTFSDILDAGSAMSVDVLADSYVVLDATKLLGAAFVRFEHLDAAGVSVAETAQRQLRPVFRAFE